MLKIYLARLRRDLTALARFGSNPGGGGSRPAWSPAHGPLEGALGVLAALECLRTIREAGLPVKRPLAVVAWSDEEGRYGSLFGSRAFTGKLDAAKIPEMRASDGERLGGALARAGFNAREAPPAPGG